MRRLIYLCIVFPLVLWMGAASATPLTGQATVLDPSGLVVTMTDITGDLDTTSGTMSVDPFSFFGFQFFTTSVELLEEGTHTRPDGAGGTIGVTVEPGQLGAYMVFEWSISEFRTFMVWDVSATADGGAYTTIDSDGDGIPGHAFVTGPFPGFTLTYDFVVAEPPPGITVSIEVDGGTVQECSEIGGSQVTLNAATDLVGGAELGSIDWFVDGESAGSGASLVTFMALGSHSVEVLASTTTGESDSDSATVDVRDTTMPELNLAFLDRAGNPVTEAGAGELVTTHIAATDICDPEPTTEGSAVPVFEVNDGDSIRILGGRINTVRLPTTAVELSAMATDASGNKKSGMTVLSITD